MLLKRVFGSVFLCLHLAVILVVYFDFVFVEYLPDALEGDVVSILVLSFFHLFCGFELVALVQMVVSSPGNVPRYWVILT
jgi:hypothetical protein